jgi:hypothetical protein
LVENEIAAGRRISEFLYTILGGFNGCHSAAPQHAAGLDPENVKIRNHGHSLLWDTSVFSRETLSKTVVFGTVALSAVWPGPVKPTMIRAATHYVKPLFLNKMERRAF